jgi:hypothetical protein
MEIEIKEKRWKAKAIGIHLYKEEYDPLPRLRKRKG